MQSQYPPCCSTILNSDCSCLALCLTRFYVSTWPLYAPGKFGVIFAAAMAAVAGVNGRSACRANCLSEDL